MESEIGKRYGKLTVIEDTGKRYHQTKLYKCLCDCGNYKEVNTNQLHSGHVTSCGCAKHKIRDLTGLKFGRVLRGEVVAKSDGAEGISDTHRLEIS